MNKLTRATGSPYFLCLILAHSKPCAPDPVSITPRERHALSHPLAGTRTQHTGGRCTQANMCKYKGKTLSDSFWVLLNTAWPTQPHQCGAAGKRAETVCLWGQHRKQKDMKYLEKSNVLHLLSLTHSFECRQKGCEPTVCCYTEGLSLLWGCCVGFLPWVNSILYFYTITMQHIITDGWPTANLTALRCWISTLVTKPPKTASATINGRATLW